MTAEIACFTCRGRRTVLVTPPGRAAEVVWCWSCVPLGTKPWTVPAWAQEEK